MRRLIHVIALVAIIAAAGSARAQEEDACGSQDAASRIAPCTAVIEAPDAPPLRRAEAYFRRGLAYSQLGQYERSIPDYDGAIRIEPWFGPALNNRANAYLKLGRPSEGVADIEQALGLAPNDPVFNATRGEIAQALGDRELAMQHHDAAMAYGGVPFIKLYQCRLKMARLYHGPLDGILTSELRAALRLCVDQGNQCTPLPPFMESECVEPVA